MQYQEINANLTSIGTICVQAHTKARKGRGRIPGHSMAVSERLPSLRPLSNYMKQNTSWEDYSCPANQPFKEQEGSLSCWSPCWTKWVLSTDTDALFLLDPSLCCPPSTPLFDVFFPFRFFDYNFVWVSHFSHACYMPSSPHSPGFFSLY
jgi:hypothetical protein